MTAEQAMHWLNFVSLDEPVFVLRGRDPLTPKTIRFWAEGARLAGVNEQKVLDALRVAGACEAWPVKKLPG